MKTKRITMTALCMAWGVIFPMVFHSVPNAGSIFLPMHLPVLLCGLVSGPGYGLICGVVVPVLSFLFNGMPKVPYLFSMMFELGAYGLIAGSMKSVCKTRNFTLNVVLSLVSSMLIGRVVYGLVNALVFQAGSYSLSMWISASFVTALPGILIQLAVLPPLAVILHRMGAIE